MKAYEVKRGTKVTVTDDVVSSPPDSIGIKKGDEITIDRLDGMYCNGTNSEGDMIYIAAWTEVEPLK